MYELEKQTNKPTRNQNKKKKKKKRIKKKKDNERQIKMSVLRFKTVRQLANRMTERKT